MEVVGQADTKFIIALCRCYLYVHRCQVVPQPCCPNLMDPRARYAIDQHAAAERIQLEHLTEQLQRFDPEVIAARQLDTMQSFTVSFLHMQNACAVSPEGVTCVFWGA